MGIEADVSDAVSTVEADVNKAEAAVEVPVSFIGNAISSYKTQWSYWIAPLVVAAIIGHIL